MALRGNLQDITFTQILNLVNLAHKTGTLIVESPGETSQVSFREVKLAFASLEHENHDLPAVLNSTGRISPAQYRSIVLHGSEISDKELGLMLINAGILNRDEIMQSLQQYYSGIIHRMFTWVEGLFRFENDLLPPTDRINVRLDLENFIIEGSRQLREWEQLQDEIPSLDMALKFAERSGANMNKVNLSVEEWRVVSFINPRNSMQQIAQAVKMNDLEIRRIIYGLLQAGLVEIVRPGGQPVVSAIHPFQTEHKDEQLSLVRRLINRIRSL